MQVGAVQLGSWGNHNFGRARAGGGRLLFDQALRERGPTEISPLPRTNLGSRDSHRSLLQSRTSGYEPGIDGRDDAAASDQRRAEAAVRPVAACGDRAALTFMTGETVEIGPGAQAR